MARRFTTLMNGNCDRQAVVRRGTHLLAPALLVTALAGCGSVAAGSAVVENEPTVAPKAQRTQKSELLFTSQQPLHAGESGATVRLFLDGLGKAGCNGLKPNSDVLGAAELRVVHRFQENAEVSNEATNIGTSTANVLHDSQLYGDTSCGATFAPVNLMPGCWGVFEDGELKSDGRLVVAAGPPTNISKCLSAPAVAAKLAGAR